MNQETEELKDLVAELKKKIRYMLPVFLEFYNLNLKEINEPDSLNDFSEIRLKPFKISNLVINNPIISAPMAGISDNTFRIFAKYLGCSLTFSEMATSYGLIYNHKKTLEIVKPTDFEKPCAVQIFGNDPDIMAEAAGLIEENSDIIDINMGCPVPKVLKTGSGGSLLNDPEAIGRIIRRLRAKIKKPLTVKLRIGWDETNINVIDISRIVEDEGADAVTIHGRTVKQGYSGKADYGYIRKVKSCIKIPVIVSGDIESVSKAKWVSDYTGCDGLMIGRTARGNPWIFSELLFGLLSLSRDKESEPAGLSDKNTGYMEVSIGKSNFYISNDLKADFLLLYLKFLIYFKGEEKSVKEFRKFLGWAFKGIRNVSEIRNEFFKIDTLSDAKEILDRLR